MIGMEYNVDMVFCIDATSSMTPVIDTVKKNVLNLYGDLMGVMEEKQKRIHQLRVRVIIFRDYLADGDKAMLTSRFFVLPEESREFAKAIRSIRVEGGGDAPEDGLEALAYAIKSDWSNEGNINRSVICLWTDASTHEIGFGAAAKNYPEGMPKDFSELTEWWGDQQIESQYISNRAKRLILFAPDLPYWQNIVHSWNNVIHYPSRAGKGLEEVTYYNILQAIAASV